MSLSQSVGVAAYRNLLRAVRVAFHGDHRVMTAAHEQARSQFEAGRSLEAGSKEWEEKLKHASDVAVVLRQGVIQGEKVPEDEKYQLRIHKDIRLGDNESIKQSRMPGKKANSFKALKKGGCGSA
ncbi:hypothetical protein SAICODRAFT_31541 [Saitoella complicata NRRL Y-17804]|nr:uncharacterized protein SAICODRAFT_31541 [Saitoella complicata NRRL Y-17804]ODQ51021.1 hypothetical protein SAICODRAFT_31541 [Saitoella complicata NRRL Y-17804]